MSARDVSPFVGWHCTGVFGYRKMQCSEPCAWCRDEAAKNEAALTAAGYAVERGWQPIETAPAAMGSEVLLYIAPFAPMQAVRRSDGTWMVGARSIIGRAAPYNPTHWRPLPAPPAGEVK